MTIVLLYNALNSILFNFTGNEIAKLNKYAYLKDKNGNLKNIFSKGLVYNFKYYFHLIEPNHLETIKFINIKNEEV